MRFVFDTNLVISAILFTDSKPDQAFRFTTSIHACRDPKDDKFLDLAVSGKADYLISGDNDLLTLKTFQNVLIVTVNDYLNLLGYSDSQPK
ncbi:MAG: putative toxin-antitoxin system toxin component, PIN family [Chloroflexi bacterium]|nr:putative toxin-antitoxin system toxin component, PIN family [Chloroflexota bacterium]